jgi:predicted ATPase/DNA-binding SARP family transcriptional activator/tetratricopeptide (TPR) repeat protein
MEFRILGPVELGEPGSAADLGGPKERAVLARLIVSANHVVPAEQIADDIWSGRPPAHSLATLRVYVSRLRRALGHSAGVLVTRQPGYGLYAEADAVDARRFGRLAADGAAKLAAGDAPGAAEVMRAALALWRGPALADVADLPFAQPHVVRLEEDRLAVIENLMTAELACGRHAAVAGELEQLTDTYPLREQLWGLRMLALYRSGRQADALAAYHQVHAVLAGELGIDPGHALRRRHEQVLRQDPALDWRPGPAPAGQAPDGQVPDGQVPDGQAPDGQAPAPGGAVGMLPTEVSSFVGRRQELATIAELLALSRLLTLTGPGGSGKSRLAIRYASESKDEYPGGVWLIDLAPVIGSEFVVPAFAAALSVTEARGRPLLDSVIGKLGGQRALLIPDNCEHVVGAASEVISRLLAACPQVRVLATSQIRLMVDGEASWPVPPLRVPDVGAGDLASVAASEAVQLLCERAGLSRPGFKLTAENAAGVASVCRRLDGVPLAIELAAARLSALSVRTLEARLDDRFAVLTGGSRSALPRHRALAAALEWSHDLLTSAEKVCLRRLSVFAGGCSLEAAEAVCGGGQVPAGEAGEVFDAVASLIDKSLLTAQERAGVMRYRMLESIHVYAGRRLDEAGERAPVERRHLDWLLDLTGQADPDGPEQAAWLEVVQADLDNVMTGLARAIEAGEVGRALVLAGRVATFWMVRGPFGLGRHWLDAVLAAAGADADPRRRAEALDAAGQLASLQGDHGAQVAYQEESLAIWRALADAAKIAGCLGDLGNAAHVRGEYFRAEALYAEALDLALRVNDDSVTGRALSGLGRLALDRDDLDKATEYYEESMARFEAAGDLRRATAILGNLGVVASYQDNTGLARERLTRHLANARLLGDRKLTGGALTNLGMVMFNSGEAEAAWLLHQEACELGELIGDPRLTAVALINLGVVSCASRQDYDAAVAYHRRALVVAARVGESRVVVESLEELAVDESSRGRHGRAARLFGAVRRRRADLGTPTARSDASRIGSAEAAARLALGAVDYEAAYAAGLEMSLDQALEFAAADGTRDS